MRGHNICFCWEIRKITLELSQFSLLSGALTKVAVLYILYHFTFNNTLWKILSIIHAEIQFQKYQKLSILCSVTKKMQGVWLYDRLIKGWWKILRAATQDNVSYPIYYNLFNWHFSLSLSKKIPKNLDLSYKMDLDFLDCLRREKYSRITTTDFKNLGAFGKEKVSIL